MDSRPPWTRPPPEWLAASVVVGFVVGLVPVLVGGIAAIVGGVTNWCERFGDFGCGGFVVLGFYACPLAAVVSAVVAGLTANRMAKAKGRYTGRDVWRRCFGFAFLSVFLSGPASLAVLASL